MNLAITFKGENGKLESGPYSYEFQNDELNRLRGDFQSYLDHQDNNLSPSKAGGIYTCQKNGETVLVFLKFDEIVYIG